MTTVNIATLLAIFLTFSIDLACAQESDSQPVSGKDNARTETMMGLEKTFSVGIRTGRNQLLPSAVSENPTLLRIGDYNARLDLRMEYYLWEDTSILLNTGLLYIPEEKVVDSFSWAPGSGTNGINAKAHGKGGAIVPLTLGLKQAIAFGSTHPFVSGGLGFTYIIVGEGTAMMVEGTKEKFIDRRSQTTLSWSVGTGVQQHWGRSLSLDIELDWFGSPRLATEIGSINQFSGWYLSAGISYYFDTGWK